MKYELNFIVNDIEIEDNASSTKYRGKRSRFCKAKAMGGRMKVAQYKSNFVEKEEFVDLKIVKKEFFKCY
jgi:hypothetical protein